MRPVGRGRTGLGFGSRHRPEARHTMSDGMTREGDDVSDRR